MASIATDYNTDVLRSVFAVVVAAPVKLFATMRDYAVRARAERELMAMDNYQLSDIGIAREEIHARVWGK